MTFPARAGDTPHAPKTFAITNARIIDGHGNKPVEHGTLLINGDKIESVGDVSDVELPAGIEVLDARGMTAMPGLNDMHVHVPGAFKYQAYLDTYVYAGVTTLLDTGNPGDFIFDLRDAIKAGSVRGPRLYIVGPIIDSADPYVPAGGISVVSKDQVPRYVEWLATRQPDFMKLYHTLSDRLVNVLAMEGRERGVRSIIDQWDRDGSTDLTRSGVAGYAHMPIRALTDDEIERLVQYKTFFLSTLTILEENSGRRWLEGPSALESPLVRDTVSRPELDLWQESYGQLGQNEFDLLAFDPVDIPGILGNVRRLLDAGVVIAAGTDSLHRGVFPGECIHREMELLVEGGATPLEAITAATKNGAVIMEATDEWGTLEAGRTANIVLVSGKPDRTISDTRTIDSVFLAGEFVDRERLKISQDSNEIRWFSPPDSDNYTKWWDYPVPEQ